MRKFKRLTKDEYIDQFADLGGDISWSEAAKIAEHEYRLNAKQYGKTVRALAAIVALAAQGNVIYTNSPELKRFLTKAYPNLEVELTQDESSYIRARFNV